MYYKEEIIDGILMYRTEPGGMWYPVSKETLTRRLKEAEKNLGRTGKELESVNEENVQLLAANQELQDENKRLTEELSAYKVQMESIAQKVNSLYNFAVVAYAPVPVVEEFIMVIG